MCCGNTKKCIRPVSLSLLGRCHLHICLVKVMGTEASSRLINLNHSIHSRNHKYIVYVGEICLYTSSWFNSSKGPYISYRSWIPSGVTLAIKVSCKTIYLQYTDGETVSLSLQLQWFRQDIHLRFGPSVGVE